MRATSISGGRFGPAIKELNDEDEISAGGIAAYTCDISSRSGANIRTRRFVAGVQWRGGLQIAAPPAAPAGLIEDDFQLLQPLNFHVIQINACLMAPAVDRI